VREVLNKRLEKLDKHYEALSEYKKLIDKLGDVYNVTNFNFLPYEKRAYLESYLKRFASIQDYLGAKIFPLLIELSGISNTKKMSEILNLISKEEIIDIDTWLEMRRLRNELEHDYPDDLEEALQDLKICVDNYKYLIEIREKIEKFINENIR
jgi:hypothetical protein